MALRILIAEDSETNRMLLRMTLSRVGLDAEIVANGAEAVRFFKEKRYDLVFLDLNMPVMNGVQAARAMRKLRAGDIPMYAISGYPSEEMESQFPEVGISRCLIKPLDAGKIMDVMAECGFGSLGVKSADGPAHIPKNVMQTYARELRSRGNACRINLNAGIVSALLREAHTIRALADMLGMQALGEAARLLEDACVQKDIPGMESLTAALERACLEAADKTESGISS